MAQFSEITPDSIEKQTSEGMSPKSTEMDFRQDSDSPSDITRTNSQSISNTESSSMLSSMGSSSNNSAEQASENSPKSEQRCSFDINSMFNNNNEKTGSPLEQLSQQLGVPLGSSSDFSPSSFSSSSLGLAGSPASFGGVETNALFQLSQLLGQQTQAVSSENIFNFNGLEQKRQPANNRPVNNKAPVEDKKRFCVLCNKNVHSSKLPCHIRQCHVSKPMFQCPSCDFTSTYSKNNVKSHMVSLHGLAGEPISYMDQYAGQVEEYMKKCFPNVRGRGRPVHDRTSPRSTQPNISVQQTTLQKMQMNGGPVRPTGRQQKHKLVMNGINMGNNKMNEVMQMLQGNKSVMEKSCMPQMNPLAYFQSLGYFNQMMGQNPYLNRFNPFEPKKEAEPVAPKNEQVTMEQLLQEFSSFVPQQLSEHKISESSSSNSTTSSSAAPPDVDNLDTMCTNGTHEMPKYLPHPLKIASLTKKQIQGTVFASMNEGNDLIERMDFEALSAPAESQVLLSSDQTQKIAEVRQKLQLQAFEVLFAVHRLDLDVLPLPKVNLVLSIAPTETDGKRFAAFEQKNQRSLNEDEDFVFQLSRVERLRERLTLMQFMGGFESVVQKLDQQITDLQIGSNFLSNSTEFHRVLQLLLTIINVVNGHTNLDLIHGFRTSKVSEICGQKLSNGQDLMECLADAVAKNFSDIQFTSGAELIDAAANTDVAGLQNTLRGLERGRTLVEAELKYGTQTDNLTEFALKVEREVISFKEKINKLTGYLRHTLEFFGESVSAVYSEEFDLQELSTQVSTFFKQISRFCRSFQTALMSI
ncbi:unnamed protein product [Bursaphelenchus okinawaensis]|uniref:FH2 domain-containing protein n=1 Tax=Bursaphelenchus okinawaensis TaxID=465554 RepID=A0A811KK09_9BILA|nr:unnamed protein product [Bursaphelenchus okinawaensis]CAG9105309.1 unnamed protein product [Bursaphelenchus okinawaensis]